MTRVMRRHNLGRHSNEMDRNDTDTFCEWRHEEISGFASGDHCFSISYFLSFTFRPVKRNFVLWVAYFKPRSSRSIYFIQSNTLSDHFPYPSLHSHKYYTHCDWSSIQNSNRRRMSRSGFLYETESSVIITLVWPHPYFYTEFTQSCSVPTYEINAYLNVLAIVNDEGEFRFLLKSSPCDHIVLHL